MAAKALPSQEVLRQLLDYDPETGALTWRYRSVEDFTATSGRSAAWLYRQWCSRFNGRPAFTADNGRGYLRGKIAGEPYLAHRIVWNWVYGEDAEQIDHINGNRADNRICNLRSVCGADNSKNKKRYSRNQTGVTGISRRYGKWIVKISLAGRDKQLGSFKCFGKAVRARKSAEQRLGFHENHGRAA